MARIADVMSLRVLTVTPDETVQLAITRMLEENVGHQGRKFLGLVGTLGLFILLSNLLGLIPFFSSPTVSLNVPLPAMDSGANERLGASGST